MSTTITIPLKVRVVAYVLTLLPFDGLAAWFVSAEHVSASLAALIGLALGALHTTTGVFALAHLTIPDDSGSSVVGDAQAAAAQYANSVSYVTSLPGYAAQQGPAAAVMSAVQAASDPVVGQPLSQQSDLVIPEPVAPIPVAAPEPVAASPVASEPVAVPPAPEPAPSAPVAFQPPPVISAAVPPLS